MAHANLGNERIPAHFGDQERGTIRGLTRSHESCCRNCLGTLSLVVGSIRSRPAPALSDVRLSPFFSVGFGNFKNLPNSTLVGWYGRD